MFIAFEGPIAAGKTSLANRFSARSDSTLILEKFSENEYLADFYEDKERWSFPVQMWFLFDRHKQMDAYVNSGEQLLVADYAFIKDNVFARLLLRGRELRLFQRASSALGPHLLRPDLFVYLDAENDVLLERIAGRGRSYESHIDAVYLDKLREAYDSELKNVPGRESIQFDTSALDLNSPSQLRAIFDAIDDSLNHISSPLKGGPSSLPKTP